MADEGPTTVGSIDAKLDIDKTSWERKAEEVKAEARELGALEPTVKVDANVGAALAQLGAVSAAADELNRREQEELVTKGRLSNALIDEGIQRKHAAAAAKYEADQVTWNNSALKKQIDARNAAKQAAEDAAAATEHGTTAVEADTAAGEDNISVNRRRVSGLQVLIALAPAILAAAAPVASAAVGLGVAFGVMGGAGVLAVMGIKNAMQQGTAVGNAYSDGLGALKTDLDELANTSATKMLGSFQATVGDINQRMPFLNQMVGEASSALGVMGGTALSGVLVGLQTMNPLIQTSEIELSKLVSWLTGFGTSDGFSQFITYAVANLPAVVTLIEGIVTTAGHLLAAFAPLGPEILGFLNGFIGLLNSLPLPVLAGLVTSATLLGPALRFAFSSTVTTLITAAAKAIGLTATMTELAVPVVGILLAAMSGLAVMAATTAASTQTNTVAVQDYTQALKDDNDQIGANVRAVAAKALVDDGAAAAAQRHGIALSTLLDASLGVPSAMDTVRAANKQLGDSMVVVAGHMTTATAQNKADFALLGQTVGSAGDQIDATKTKQQQMNALLGDTSAVTTQTSAVQAMAAQYGVSTAAYESAVQGQSGVADQLASTTVQMQLQNDAAGLLKQALDKLNGKAISAAQAQNSFDSSLVNMGTHMSATGKKVHFTTTSINDMSSASVALRGQLNSQVQNLQNVVEANGGLANSTGKAREQMKTMRQQIIDNAVAHGVDRDAVTRYIDKILAIPKTVPPTQLQIDDAAARASIASYQAAVNALRGKVVWITTNYKSIYSEEHVSTGQGGSGGQTRSSGGLIYRAAGGPVTDYLASGGFPGHPVGSDTVPAWLTPGEMVIRRASAESIGQPALNYMNQTGKLPSSGPETVTVNMVLDGRVIDTRIVRLSTLTAGNVLKSAVHDAKNRRS